MRYIAVVLTPASRSALLAQFGQHVPQGWVIDAHHMTINLGAADVGPAAGLVGQESDLTVVSVAGGATVVAVGVACVVPSHNRQPHVTLAVNTATGGRSRDAKSLADWSSVEPLTLRGTVQEVA